MTANDNAVVLYSEKPDHIAIEIVGDDDLCGLVDRFFRYDQWKAADDFSAELMCELNLPIRYRRDRNRYPLGVEPESIDAF